MIPQSMRVIQDFAFGGCRELMRIEIPNGVEYLGNHIFNGCLCLKSILLPSSLKKVEEYAFPDNFTTLFDKSSGVKLISDCLLSQSNELLWISAHTEELRLPEYVTYKNETCKTYHDCIVTISGVLLWTAPNINRFTFPAGIKEIGGKSFIWNNEIKDLKIPFGVEIIRKEAWESCLQFLDSIYLPSTLRQIEKTNLDKSTIQKETLYRYPREIHIPPRMSRFFTRLLNNNCLNFIEDYCETQ
jgi:hypothetical protein